MSLRTDGSISNRAGTGPAAFTKQWAAKMWANLNGTGTIAFRDSKNVSSATDLSTGAYLLNLTSAMANSSYAYLPAGDAETGTVAVGYRNGGMTAGVVPVRTYASSFAPVDTEQIMAQIQGDLA